MNRALSRKMAVMGAIGLTMTARAAFAQEAAPYAQPQVSGPVYQMEGQCSGTPYDSTGAVRCFQRNTALPPQQRRTDTMPAPQAQSGDDIDVWNRYGTPLPRQVAYTGTLAAGNIVVDNRNHRLYFIEGNGRATEYVVAVGAPQYTMPGNSYTVERKALNPDWRPTPTMLRENPDWLPFYPGGPENPMGSAALYLRTASGSTLYRIHGTNDPEMLGRDVTDGCIRLHNADILVLYNQVRIGARVTIDRTGAISQQIAAVPAENKSAFSATPR